MKSIIKPLLIVGGYNEMDILQKYSGNFDILVSHDYQKIHFDAIFKYMAPEYWKKCPALKTLEKTEKKIQKSGYRNFYKYMLVKYLQKASEGRKMSLLVNYATIYDKKDFKEYLRSEHPVFMKSWKIDVFTPHELKKNYQTIVINFGNKKDCNYWNRYYGIRPNYSTDEMYNKALRHLNEGGKVIFLKWSLWRILDFVSNGFERLDDCVYVKNVTDKKEWKYPRLGL